MKNNLAKIILMTLLSTPVFASVIPIPSPAYLVETEKCSILGGTISSLTNGTETLSFSSVFSFPGDSLEMWGLLPNVESEANVGALAAPADPFDFQLSLGHPVLTFGLEIANIDFKPATVTVLFRSGTTLIDSMSRSLDSNGDALLFAETGDVLMDNVLVSSSDASLGLALGQIRYAFEKVTSDVSEPTSLALFCAGLVGLCTADWRRRSLLNRPR